MSVFRRNIIKAINDEALQTALDKNAEQRLIARQHSYSDLDEDFLTLKQRAHKIKLDVLENLDSVLEEFSQNAERNGFIIHRADNAAEARRIVLDICLKNNTHLVAKSKTMMSEEVTLNPALLAKSIDVVETDLGEFIVQLRGEHPSHIITPAVHLRREDVGETFHRKLGIHRTDDIEVLTNSARSFLRKTFLSADIGISGVNLGVADTGSICIVTNEGNGRMVTTIPKIHIALMGIERLVPDLHTLSLILKMLPRSATGQKITVYTQIISGPRRTGEIDGSVERHLVLIDNGRSSLRHSSLAEILLCIRCGACINACPVFREIGGFSYTSTSGKYTPYPGPVGSILSPGLFGIEEFGHLAQASTLCGACKEACPMDIDLPTLLLRIRSGEVSSVDQTEYEPKPVGISPSVSFGLKTFTWLSTKPYFFKTSFKISGIIAKLLSPRNSWMMLPRFTGWGFSKDFPRPAKNLFRELWNGRLNQQDHLEDRIRQHKIDDVEINKKPIDLINKQSSIVRFKNEFTALNGNLIECDLKDLSSQIITILRKKHINNILAWESDYLPESLVVDLLDYGIGIDHGVNPELKAGLTGTIAAIADTGTIVLASGVGRPSSTSLLPETHIAILHQKDIYENLSQVFCLQEILDASSVIFISGPSRTADIEMTLTIGVHGPKEVYVCLLND